MFNVILSNGQRSTQRDQGTTYFTHMLPKDAHKLIRSAEIYYNTSCIWGFHFFDQNHSLIWKIGRIDPDMKVETVLLAEKEVIIGVVARLLLGKESMFTNWQF